jgi:hypothetical protein
MFNRSWAQESRRFPKAGPGKDWDAGNGSNDLSRSGLVNSLAYCVGKRSGLPLSIQVLAVFRMAVTAVALNRYRRTKSRTGMFFK